MLHTDINIALTYRSPKTAPPSRLIMSECEGDMTYKVNLFSNLSSQYFYLVRLSRSPRFWGWVSSKPSA